VPVYYEVRPINQRCVSRIECDSCGKSIPMMFANHLAIVSGEPQGVDMLTLTVSGGYGEYIDGKGEVYICGTCALQLEGKNPIISKALELARGQ
jgi:hypothetical protein